VTDHYSGFDGVLVRLSQINQKVLKGLLMMAHNYLTRKARPRATR
jgi:hypothetical protein